MNRIGQWNVENESFWAQSGRLVGQRNLWISIPALFLAFSTWMMWSIIIVQMQKLGFSLGETDPLKTKELLYMLPAIAGLAGATLRIPNSFLVPIGGGRNVIFITTASLLISAIGTGVALMSKQTPFYIFALFAALSGFGGGNFSSSMANITSFFPKKEQGTALGLNAGLGNLGVSGMQFLLPFVMGMPLLSLLGEGFFNEAGQTIFIQNAGFVWAPMILLSIIAVWFGMNNLQQASPGLSSDTVAMGHIVLFLLVGTATSLLGAFLLVNKILNVFLILPLIVLLTLFLLKILAPTAIKERLNNQFKILTNKHNWVMTIIYVMTFGSFIGYAASFPKLIQDVFGYFPDGTVNPQAPNPMKWAWLGPFLGAMIRPIGGYLSDKIKSGSRVTAWSTVIQIVGAIGVAYYVVAARNVATPEIYWPHFFCFFMLLFLGSGLGNGSTFRSVPYIFPKEIAPSVLGWTGAIGAYGSLIIPKMFGEQIAKKTPEYALYGFTVYYLICLVLNWYFYDRKNSDLKC